jgi:hypothetical protein
LGGIASIHLANPGLTRSFAKSGDRSTIERLTDLAEFFSKHGRLSYLDMSIERGLQDSSPAAADGLISHWLRHKIPDLRIYALKGLAGLRLGRTIPAIISVLSDKTEDKVRQEASVTLSVIGSAAAAQSLAGLLASFHEGPGIDWAFSTHYMQPISWPHASDRIASALSSDGEVQQQMLLSLGWRGNVAFQGDIETGLTDYDHVVRGTSALALAHLLGPDAIDALNNGADEAANEWETVFMLAAQIHAERFDCGDALQAALQQLEWETLRPVWKREILSALVLADGDTRRAELWAEIAGERLDRIFAEVVRLRSARREEKH